MEILTSSLSSCCLKLRLAFISYGGPKVSRQFQFHSRQFQFVHGNFNLPTAISVSLTAILISLTAVSTYSRQFQLAHGNFNLFTAISTCSRLFQFTHGNFAILLIDKALSIFSRQRSQHFSLRTPPVSYNRRQWPCTKSQNAKSKVDISSRSSKRKVKITNQKSIYELA